MTTEVLPLRQTSRPGPDDCATRPVASEILESFRFMFAHAEVGPEHAPLDADVSRQAADFADARGVSATAAAGRLVVAACRAAAAAVARRQAARHRDLASLVAFVREAADSLATGHAVSTAALSDSTTRLEGMQQVSDFSEMKQLLAAEVVTLRRIAADREREHQRTVALLHDRIALAEEQLSEARHEARVDPLTAVANRRGFDAVLAERVATSDPASRLVLALLDVDDFKQINDRFGHPAGDAVLQQVAQGLRDSLRQDDFVARLGGDEFALIASGLTLAQAESRLRMILNRITANVSASHDFAVSVSAGVSEHSAGDTVQTLMSRTDTALNDAKLRGKGRVVGRGAPYIRKLLKGR